MRYYGVMTVEIVPEIPIQCSWKSYSQTNEKLCQGKSTSHWCYKSETGRITSTPKEEEANCFVLALFPLVLTTCHLLMSKGELYEMWDIFSKAAKKAAKLWAWGSRTPIPILECLRPENRHEGKASLPYHNKTLLTETIQTKKKRQEREKSRTRTHSKPNLPHRKMAMRQLLPSNPDSWF